MPVTLEFTIEGERQVARRLEIAADGVKDFSEPLGEVDKEVMHSVDLNYGARGALFGGWRPRTKSYPWPLLEQTGTMRSSFVSKQDSTSVTFGNTDWKFPYHQSNKSRSKIPRRVMLKIDNIRRNFIIKAFQRYIIEVTGRGTRT